MHMLALAYFAAQPDAGGFSLQLNDLISGGTGAALMGAIIFVGKLVLDRTIPSRSDQRANVSLVLEGLSNMVKVLQEEKTADSRRLAEKQERIDLLESAADVDYTTIGELRREILELRGRLTQKDRHIRQLVEQLRKLGATVTGIDIGPMELPDSVEITLPSHVRRVDRIADPESPEGRASSSSLEGNPS